MEKASTMRAIGETVLVMIDKEQKNSHKISTPNGDIELYISRDTNFNSRERNHTCGTVISDSKNYREGEIVVFHHNSCTPASMVDESNGVHEIYSVRDSHIFFKLIDGDEVPVGEYMIAKRLYEPSSKKSKIILSTENKKLDDRFYIESVSEDVEGIKSGDVVISAKMSDYEVVYHFNGREQRCVRIRESDVYAIDNSMKKGVDYVFNKFN